MKRRHFLAGTLGAFATTLLPIKGFINPKPSKKRDPIVYSGDIFERYGQKVIQSIRNSEDQRCLALLQSYV